MDVSCCCCVSSILHTVDLISQKLTRASRSGTYTPECGLSVNKILMKDIHTSTINPYPHVKILDLTELKAFADGKLNVTKMIISVYARVENIVGKGDIAYTNTFSYSYNVFKGLLSQTLQKVSLCGNGLNKAVTGEMFTCQILDAKEYVEDETRCGF